MRSKQRENLQTENVVLLGNNHPGILQRWGILLPVLPGELRCPTQRKFFLSSAEWNTSYSWVPTERKCSSILEAASHAAVSRSPHTWLTSPSPLISFHSDKWVTEINLKSDSENFSRGFFFKVKTRNLRFHSKRQTKWMWSLAEAKCVMMGFGIVCHCQKISESRATTNENLNHKSLSPLTMRVLIWATSSKLCFLT